VSTIGVNTVSCNHSKTPVSIPSRGRHCVNLLKKPLLPPAVKVSIPSRGRHCVNLDLQSYREGPHSVSIPSRGRHCVNWHSNVFVHSDYGVSIPSRGRHCVNVGQFKPGVALPPVPFPSPLGEDIVSTQYPLAHFTISHIVSIPSRGRHCVNVPFSSAVLANPPGFHPLSGKTLCQLLAQEVSPSKGFSLQIDRPISFGRILFSSSKF
jgi:hypothetical protein